MPSESAGNRRGQAVPRTSLGISNYSALFSLCRALHNEKDGDSDLARLVDHVIRDARTGKGEETLRQEVQQHVVTPEGRGLAVPVPVRLADD